MESVFSFQGSLDTVKWVYLRFHLLANKWMVWLSDFFVRNLLSICLFSIYHDEKQKKIHRINPLGRFSLEILRRFSSVKNKWVESLWRKKDRNFNNFLWTRWMLKTRVKKPPLLLEWRVNFVETFFWWKENFFFI